MSLPDRPVTVREAAEHMQHSEEVIRRWARAGRLPGWKDLAGEWRFDREVILARCGGRRRAERQPEPQLTERAADIAAHVQAARAQLRLARAERGV